MFRSATPADLDRLLAVEAAASIALVSPERYRADLALGRYHLEWTWLAEEGGELLGRALWWGLPDSLHPVSLDCVWISPSVPRPEALAEDLIDHALRRFRTEGMRAIPDANFDLDAAWRESGAARAGVEWRVSACRANGLTEWVERVNHAWTADRAVPEGTVRLRFEEADDAAFLDAFRRAAVGSLDVLTVRTLEAVGPELQAQDDLDFYLSLPGERSMWRLAYDGEDRLVGFAIASRSAYDASVSYLGVLPEHRGLRYSDDLLAEITRLHVAHGAERVTGTTDSTNTPMLAAFARAGYAVSGVRMVGSARPTSP